jgi:hypothetical protein
MGNGNRANSDGLDEAALDRFFTLLDHLDQSRLMQLQAMARVANRAERDEAWKEVRRAAEANGLLDAIQQVRDRVFQWAGRGTNVPPLQPVPVDFEMLVTTRMGAAGPLVDAAAAIALGDLLDEASREILVGPWLAVTGTPG